MNSLAHFLALGISQDKFSKAINNAQFLEDSDGETWLHFETNALRKGGPYKKKLIDILWGSLELMHETHVSASMLRQGYMLIKIEGGELVVTPSGEEYQLIDNSCTCPVQVEGPCKHLTFRDWHNHYRARTNEYRLKYLKR